MRFLTILLAVLALVGPHTSDARPRHQYTHHTRSFEGGDYYTNSRGHRVHRPMRSNRPPAGASAKCGDGSYSFSESRRGTCSWHGGVAQWL